MKELKVGLIGAGFMAKAHAIAYSAMPIYFNQTQGTPVKQTLADVTQELAEKAAANLGFQKATGNWRDIINDPEIDIVDICTPNYLHYEMAVEAAKAGKHIICEKPLASTVSEAKAMVEAARKAGVVDMIAYNYRRVPAIALAKKLIGEGAIGDLLDFRGTYFQNWSADASTPLSWRFQKHLCGSGALGDIGAHVIDLTRFLIGDFDQVNGMTATYIKERPIQSASLDQLGAVKGGTAKGEVNVDDFTGFMVKCKNGVQGYIEASRNARGRNNFIILEIHGTQGTIYFNYERMNELQIYYASDPAENCGFKTIYTGPAHPYGEALWPIPALGIGYTEIKIIEVYDLIRAIVEKVPVMPTFRDGLAVELIADAVLKSARNGKWEKVEEII